MNRCTHLDGVAATLRPPGPGDRVYKDECTLCFDDTATENGIDVCLACFNAGCPGRHGPLHHRATGHVLALNIKRTPKPSAVGDDARPEKLTKLSIQEDNEEEKWNVETTVYCYGCDGREPIKATPEVEAVVQGIMTSVSAARQSEIKAWENELSACEHTLYVEQELGEPAQLEHCTKCELAENLWLCLTCGNLGCGRAQFGGVGGNSHGLAHYDESQHPVSVKLGSITPDGGADIYCYACNEERVDPELKDHLAHWGINIAERQKVEKSLTEMQIEQNMKWDFKAEDGEGNEMPRITGKDLTGFRNLGNTCYIASVVQAMFSLREFQNVFLGAAVQQEAEALAHPAADLQAQLYRIADGLHSGRYAAPLDYGNVPSGLQADPRPHGINPSILKELVGKGHEEFSTMRQQDAYEYFLHFEDMISKARKGQEDPTEAFRFVVEQRLQCLGCNGVRYREDIQDSLSIPVPAQKASENPDEHESVSLLECLDLYTREDRISYTCQHCKKSDGATTRLRFSTFPEVLAMNVQRFHVVNWVPQKLNICIRTDADSLLDLSRYRATGPKPDENVLPDDDPADPLAGLDESAVEQLEAMGFPKVRAQRALLAVGNAGAEPAMNWLFEHMEDSDIDEPISRSNAISDASVSMVCDMGFGVNQATKALKATNNDVSRAIEWLFENNVDDSPEPSDTSASSAPRPGRQLEDARYRLDGIVSHKGASIHVGHYVAYLRKASGWALFNDEKVFAIQNLDEAMQTSYMYFMTLQ